MFVKKMVNVAEKQIGNVSNQVTDVFTIGRKSAITRNKSSEATIIQPTQQTSLMANTLLWTHLIPPVPLIASTMFRHYAKGPPAKSWSLSTDITIAIIRDFLNRFSKITVEDIQKISTTKKLPVPYGMNRIKFTVPNEYRQRAGDILKKQFTAMDEHSISWDWEKDRENAPPIKGEWLQLKGNPLDPSKESTVFYLHGGAYYLGCYGIYRQFLGRLIKYSNSRTCSINYRLAPQHPFPAAVEDALATYLYLIDPPKDEVTQPIDPNKIVIAGDSAGGGLTFALLMAIRDAKLPIPAGAMALSPWLDLTHSLPSILSNIMTDYLPPIGFKHAPSPALDYAQHPLKKENVTSTETYKQNQLDEPDSFGPFSERVSLTGIDNEDIHRVQFYTDNHALKLPMVSPIFDRKKLRGFPRLLIQCGVAERLRDESVYAALQASNSFPGADTDPRTSEQPTHIILEMFTDQPHVFQLLFSNKSVSKAMKNLATFVREVTSSFAVDKSIDGYMTDNNLTIRKICPNGKLTDIKEDYMKEITSETWNDWENRLARQSIKERIDNVTSAYDKILLEDTIQATEV